MPRKKAGIFFQSKFRVPDQKATWIPHTAYERVMHNRLSDYFNDIF